MLATCLQYAGHCWSAVCWSAVASGLWFASLQHKKVETLGLSNLFTGFISDIQLLDNYVEPLANIHLKMP